MNKKTKRDIKQLINWTQQIVERWTHQLLVQIHTNPWDCWVGVEVSHPSLNTYLWHSLNVALRQNYRNVFESTRCYVCLMHCPKTFSLSEVRNSSKDKTRLQQHFREDKSHQHPGNHILSSCHGNGQTRRRKKESEFSLDAASLTSTYCPVAPAVVYRCSSLIS